MEDQGAHPVIVPCERFQALASLAVPYADTLVPRACDHKAR